jgi:hypothetical protein
MDQAVEKTLAELAIRTAVNVERAPGPAEKRLALMRGFAEAYRVHEAVPEDPNLAVLDTLLQQPEQLVQNLKDFWCGHSNSLE